MIEVPETWDQAMANVGLTESARSFERKLVCLAAGGSRNAKLASSQIREAKMKGRRAATGAVVSQRAINEKILAHSSRDRGLSMSLIFVAGH